MSATLMLGCDDSTDNEFGAAIGNAICDTGDGGLLEDGGTSGPLTGGIDGGMLDASIGIGDGGTPIPTRPAVPQDTFIPLTEGQVVGVALALHMGEVDGARLALARIMNPEVRLFAEEMVAAHEAAQQRLIAVGIVPEPSTKTSELQDGAKAAAQLLTNVPDGPTFDGAYIQAQVTAHTRARTLFDAVLRKNAVSPLLQTELKAERDEAVHHLVDAQALVDDAPRVPMVPPSSNPGTGAPTPGSTGGTTGGFPTGTSGVAGSSGPATGGTGGISTGGPGFP